MIAGSAASVLAIGILTARVAGAAAPTRPVAEALHVEPNGCFDAASLAPILARWLQRDVLDRRIAIAIAGRPGSAEGLTLRVLRDGRVVGERAFPDLSGPCDDVRAAVGLAAALAVDATMVDALAVVAPPPPRPPAPTAVSRTWPRFVASLEVTGLFGVLPSAVAAFEPRVGVRVAPPFELHLSALASASSGLSLDGRSYGVTVAAARFDACAAAAASIVRFRGCAGLAGGRLQASSASGAPPVTQAAPWGAAIARADVHVAALSWLAFVLGGDAFVPLTRPRFEILSTKGGVKASTGLPLVGGAVSVGPEIIFP